MDTILVTGAAGFIGFWTAQRLLKQGHQVIGIDNFNDYYDVSIKRDRAEQFRGQCKIYECDITDYKAVERIFDENKIGKVCHLAAQAGVRYSLTHPFTYESTNITGTLNLLELCRHKGVKTFVYASSSSVYGDNKKMPFSVEDNADHPISLYAATKKCNELMAYTYHHLFGLHCTGLRFFTAYGPWGRPDMALFKFTKAILAGQPIDVYNFGKMKRDFTFIADIVDGITTSLEKSYPCEIFNLGNSSTVELSYFIGCIEKELGMNAKKNLLPMQPGDVPESFADIRRSTELLGFHPKVKIEEGIHEFIAWYRSYYQAP